MKFSMNEVLTDLRANGLHDEAAAVGIVLQQRAELLEAARCAMHEMCNTNAPRDSFTNAVDKLDEAISNAEK